MAPCEPRTGRGDVLSRHTWPLTHSHAEREERRADRKECRCLDPKLLLWGPALGPSIAGSSGSPAFRERTQRPARIREFACCKFLVLHRGTPFLAEIRPAFSRSAGHRHPTGLLPPLPHLRHLDHRQRQTRGTTYPVHQVSHTRTRTDHIALTATPRPSSLGITAPPIWCHPIIPRAASALTPCLDQFRSRPRDQLEQTWRPRCSLRWPPQRALPRGPRGSPRAGAARRFPAPACPSPSAARGRRRRGPMALRQRRRKARARL